MTAPRPPYGQQPHPQQPHQPQYQPAPGSEHYQHHIPPQQAYAPPPPAAKRKRKWPWIVLGVLVVIVLGSALNSGKSTPAPASGTSPVAAPAAPAAATGHTVTYQVTGTGKVTSISYTKEGFQMEQTSNARLPFSKDLTFKDDVTAFSGLSLVAQNGASSGDITCKILVDGKEIASSTSSGQYAVVTCNGTNA